MEIDLQILAFSLSLIALLSLLSGFTLYFIIRYRQRQIAHNREKQLLRLQFEQESAHVQAELLDQLMQKISQELHDNIGQSITLTMLQLRNLGKASMEQAVSEAIQTLTRVNQDIRQLSSSLNENVILDVGLDSALQRDLSIIKTNQQLDIYYSFELLDETLLPKVELILYRCIQELIHNVLKHAGARNLSLRIFSNPETLTISVTDDGIGMNMKHLAQSKGLGMKSLKQRVKILQGEMEMTSAPGEGTQVTIQIPTRGLFQSKEMLH